MLARSFDSFAKLGEPRPVTGSHPLEALKPVELQPGLLPTVTSLNTSGWAYRIGFTATHRVSYSGFEGGLI